MLVSRSSPPKRLLPDVSARAMASEEAGFALDLAQQIEQLRIVSGLTQAQLGALAGVAQQQISRLEDPEHQSNMRTVRKLLRALRAYVDTTVVPHEALDRYFRRRYQPVLHDQPDPLAVEATEAPVEVTATGEARIASSPFIGFAGRAPAAMYDAVSGST